MLHLRKSVAPTALAIAGLVVCSPDCAYAYIDPGTGSYVLQIVAASILAVGFVFKGFWKSIRDAVARVCKKRTPDEQ